MTHRLTNSLGVAQQTKNGAHTATRRQEADTLDEKSRVVVGNGPFRCVTILWQTLVRLGRLKANRPLRPPQGSAIGPSLLPAPASFGPTGAVQSWALAVVITHHVRMMKCKTRSRGRCCVWTPDSAGDVFSEINSLWSCGVLE